MAPPKWCHPIFGAGTRRRETLSGAAQGDFLKWLRVGQASIEMSKNEAQIVYNLARNVWTSLPDRTRSANDSGKEEPE